MEDFQMRYVKNLQVICLGFIFILQFIGQGTMAFAESTKAENAFFEALRVVGTKSEDKNTWSIIESVFKSDKVGLRYLGVRMLSGRVGAISKSKIIPFLAKVVMEDKSDRVRGNAMQAIANYTKMDIVVKAITKMLTDKDDFNRQVAMEIIVEKRLRKAIPALKEAVINEKDTILKRRMGEAIKLLEQQKRPAQKEDMESNRWIKQLDNPNPQKRLIAAGMIQIDANKFLGSEEAIEALLKAYKNESVKNNKLQILGTLAIIGEKNKKVISLLKRETSSKDAKIREIAKEILKEIKN